MGGAKSEDCNDIALQIWEWCIRKQIWSSARHIPGAQNIPKADTALRKFNDSVEWSLSTEVFQSILTQWGPFDIGLFAIRLNNKVNQYAAWKPDPGAKFIDAFSFSWEPSFFHAFPPFSVIAKCLQKIEEDKATEILLVPYWTTQAWFSILMNLLVDNPLVLPQSDNMLLLPHTGAQHPLKRKLRLIACKLSEQASRREVFLTKQRKLSWNLGQIPPSNSTTPTSRPGLSCVVNSISIHRTHL